jgi:hypothetical protein
MHRAYWPIFVAIILGSIPLAFALRSVLTGVTYDRRGLPLQRNQRPIPFWISIGCMCIVAAMFFAIAIVACVQGGVVMK